MSLYIGLHDDKFLFAKKEGYSPLPFNDDEINLLEHMNKEINIIDIIHDLGLNPTEYDLDNYETQQEIIYSWHNKYLDNNINGFSLPIWIENNEEYLTKLQEKFDNYINAIDVPSFRHEYNLLNDVKDICDKIIECYSDVLDDEEKSQLGMQKILKRFYDNEFLLSDFGKSYAFRGIAPFNKLHCIDYDDVYQLMNNTPLDFYRIRVGKRTTVFSKIEDILHIPYSKRNFVKEQRFSVEGCPCLYLGTSSFDCWNECRKPDIDSVFISGFRPNENGERLKILNLAISEPLIDGVYQKQLEARNSMARYLQNEMIRIFPLVIASSFSVKDDRPNRVKNEYIIPHLIMNSLHKCGFDGVAYLSKRVEVDIQYPCAVNVALPAYDICANKEYSDICKCFTITPPQKFLSLTHKTPVTYENYLFKTFKYKYKDDPLSIYENKYRDFAKCDNAISALYD